MRLGRGGGGERGRGGGGEEDSVSLGPYVEANCLPKMNCFTKILRLDKRKIKAYKLRVTTFANLLQGRSADLEEGVASVELKHDAAHAPEVTRVRPAQFCMGGKHSS